MDSLKENVFRLKTQLEGKNAISAGWEYIIKDISDISPKCKARFVASGYNQIK